MDTGRAKLRPPTRLFSHNTKIMKWVRALAFWSPHCPACGSDELRRSSRRNILEKALGLLVLPYRCNKCLQRCFRSALDPQDRIPAQQAPADNH